LPAICLGAWSGRNILGRNVTTITFIADSMHQQVDWDDPARWTGGVVPNDPTVDVIVPTITVVGSGTTYRSTINESGFHAAGSLTISNNTVHVTNLAVSHNLDLSANGSVDLNGTLTAESIHNNGSSVGGVGTLTVTGQFLNQATVDGGNLQLTAGSFTNNGIIHTFGTFTLTVSHGGFTNLSGSTLSGGSYWAGLEGTTLPGGDLYLDIGGVIATDAADIHLGPQGHIYSFDDTIHTYVSVQSSVHSIAASGKLSLAGSTFAWNDLTVDGQVILNHTTLNATQMTVDAGGIVSGAGALGGPILNNGTIIATTLDNFSSALGNGITINGPVSGSGTVEVGPAIVNVLNGHQVFTSSRLEIAAAFSNTVAFDDGHGVLTLDDYAEFTGKIRPAATGDAIVLEGVSYGSVTSYAYSGDSHQGTLAIQTAGGEIDLQFLGNFDTASFHLMAGPQTLSSDPESLQIGVDVAPAGSIAISDASITEGDSGTMVETFTVTRSGGTSAFAVNFATADNTATTADHDYVANAGTLNFDVGVNTQTISVTINGDTKLENSETFHVNLSGATNGAVISGNSALGTIANDEGTRSPHEFNGDGNNDFLWRNDNGSVATWDMNDQSSSGAAIASVSNDWHIADTGDFNGDGKSDILWRNDDGSVATWNMNDRSYDGLVIGTATNDWHIAGTGDFNGDHKTDILWRNDSGQVATWDMNDRSSSGAVIATVTNDWHIAGTGDFNGDGKTDILWRNDNGSVATWDMNDHSYSGGVIATAANDWHII
jgi:hypothetical protein